MSELERRLVHASGSAIPLPYLLGWVTWREFGWLLVAGAAVAGVLEVLRLFVGLDWAIFEKLTREYEQDNVAGYVYYAFSITFVGLAFQPAIAIPGMLMLTIGDPISGVLGSGPATQRKRLGTLAVMFGVCFLLAWPFVSAVTDRLLVTGVASAAGAAGATLADGAKPVVAGYVVDDNTTIPPFASAGIWLVLSLL